VCADCPQFGTDYVVPGATMVRRTSAEHLHLAFRIW
jgi:hypothetical protein